MCRSLTWWKSAEILTHILGLPMHTVTISKHKERGGREVGGGGLVRSFPVWQ